MDATDRVPALRLVAFATFHAASFVVAIALAAHLGGSLRSSLARLDTVSGFAFFIVFWILTALTTRGDLRRIGPDVDEPFAPAIVVSTIVAGGWNGVGVFVIFGVMMFIRAGLALLPALVLVAVIGSLLAFTVGAIAGFLYGLVDAALVAAGAFLFRWAQRLDADPAPAVAK
jgi:hypothetical protein